MRTGLEYWCVSSLPPPPPLPLPDLIQPPPSLNGRSLYRFQLNCTQIDAIRTEGAIHDWNSSLGKFLSRAVAGVEVVVIV
jgi:hypothetical protein